MMTKLMRRSDLARMATFVAVAEHGNFSLAAKHLGLKTPTVSQTISALEDGLGVRLFERTTRRVSLTKVGERLLARIGPAIGEIASAAESVHINEDDAATGTLRISMSTTGAEILMPTLKAFHEAYPKIVLDITLDDQESDLAKGSFDAGIRLGHLIAKKNIEVIPMGPPIPTFPFASPSYLMSHPPLSTPQDLQLHNCIRVRNYGHLLTWMFERGRRKFEVVVNGFLVVNNNNLMVRMVREGMGVGYSLKAHIAQDIVAGKLTPLLTDYALIQQYYLYFPKVQDLSEPVRLFAAFVKIMAAPP